EARVRRYDPVRDLLVAGAARDVEQREGGGRCALGQKRYELGVGRFLAMRRTVVECRERIVIDAQRSLRLGPSQTDINSRAGLLEGPARMHPPKVDGRFEASRTVLAAKAARQLCAQKGDDSRNAPRRERCAEISHWESRQ